MNGLGYSDTGPCKACGLRGDPEFDVPLGGPPDPCLGIVPGCFQACCGHGDEWKAYVCIGDAEPGTACHTVEHSTLRGPAALAWLQANRAKDSRK